LKSKKTIKHIAFIMDGNGRWASKRHLPRNLGHKEGIKAMMRTAKACNKLAIPYVSFYAFSTENKNRDKSEVDGLISLMREHLDSIADDLSQFGARLNVIGDISYFDSDLQNKITNVQRSTQNIEDRVVNIALNYGGRDELIYAAQQYKGSKIDRPLCDFLYTAGQPDPDILVRTGGEKRLSNFMLYQLAYTELFFSDTFWPDFSDKELNAIIDEYYNRDRRFGK